VRIGPPPGSLRSPTSPLQGKAKGRASGTKRGGAPAGLAARLVEHVTLQAQPDGNIVASFSDHSLPLGKFSARAAQCARTLRRGLPLRSLASGRSRAGNDADRLVRQLARAGLLEFSLGKSRDGVEQAVIEPQMPDYWPRTPPLDNADALVLSRFAYMRRRGHDLVLESPRAGALFKIGDAKVAHALAMLAQPQSIRQLRRRGGFPGLELLALLVDCSILLKIDPRRSKGQRRDEGDADLVLWDFHDLLFHARSTQGRHNNPIGGTYAYAGDLPPLPAVRPCWPGKKIGLDKFSGQRSFLGTLLRQRHSTRIFDDRRPITLAELARFLDATARVQTKPQSWPGTREFPEVEHAWRPYPSAGAAYEFEMYLAVHNCEGLEPGLYHYDAGAHVLVAIEVSSGQVQGLVIGAQYAIGAAAPPQIVITIAARFGRLAWKYSALAYALVLKDAGVLMQTFYLMATEMGFGACAIGIANIDLFAKMTGIEFHIEGPVGQFALGRGAEA
jgi:SagB-type dehydrogenase family enzyme